MAGLGTLVEPEMRQDQFSQPSPVSLRWRLENPVMHQHTGQRQQERRTELNATRSKGQATTENNSTNQEGKRGGGLAGFCYHFHAGVVVTAAAAALLAPLPPRRPLRRSPRGQHQLLLLVEVGLSDARQAFLPMLFTCIQKRLLPGICFPQEMNDAIRKQLVIGSPITHFTCTH